MFRESGRKGAREGGDVPGDLERAPAGAQSGAGSRGGGIAAARNGTIRSKEPDLRARALDVKAFEILVREHHRGLMAFALSLVRDEAAAEDVVQEAFLAAFENLARFDVTRDFGRWLRGIARMKYLEFKRRRRERPVDAAVLDGIEREHADWGRARFQEARFQQSGYEEGAGLLAALKACIGRLGEIARRTVDLFYVRRLKCAEIASHLTTSESAVKKRLERARESLGRCIRRRLGLGPAESPTP